MKGSHIVGSDRISGVGQFPAQKGTVAQKDSYVFNRRRIASMPVTESAQLLPRTGLSEGKRWLGNPLEHKIKYQPILCEDLVKQIKAQAKSVHEDHQQDSIEALCSQFSRLEIYKEPGLDYHNLQEVVNRCCLKELQALIHFVDPDGYTVRHFEMYRENATDTGSSPVKTLSTEGCQQILGAKFLGDILITHLEYSLDLSTDKTIYRTGLQKDLDGMAPPSHIPLVNVEQRKMGGLEKKLSILCDYWDSRVQRLVLTGTFKKIQGDIKNWLDNAKLSWNGPVFFFMLIGPRAWVAAALRNKAIFHADENDNSKILFQAFYASHAPTEVAPFRCQYTGEIYGSSQ